MDNLPLIIVAIVLVLLVVFVIGIYNGLVQRRLRIDEAFAQIEVQLKRRHDLIPNLVNAVKGYMGFEQKVLTDVTNARAAAVAAGAQGPAQQAAAENALTGTLRSLFAVVENYPELKASTNVLELQEQLTDHRESDLVQPPALQRDGPRLQHLHPGLPERPPGWPPRVHEARVLRRRARGCQRPDGRPEHQLTADPREGPWPQPPSSPRLRRTGGTRSCWPSSSWPSSGCSGSSWATRWPAIRRAAWRQRVPHCCSVGSSRSGRTSAGTSSSSRRPAPGPSTHRRRRSY